MENIMNNEIKIGDIVKVADTLTGYRYNHEMTNACGKYIKVTEVCYADDNTRGWVKGVGYPMNYTYISMWCWYPEFIDHVCSQLEIDEILKDYDGTPITKCDVCGLYHIDADIIEHEGGHYCPQCFTAHFVMCAHCGKIERKEGHSMLPYSYNKLLCKECIETLEDTEEIFFCEGHNRYEDDDGDTRWTPAEERVCSDYFHDHCYYCDRCGEVLWQDDVCWDEESYGDSGYCSDCYDEVVVDQCYTRVCGYHSKVKTKYGRAVDGKIVYDDYAPDFKGYGIELEVDTADTELEDDKDYIVSDISELTNRAFYYQEDGSLSDDGIEIISHPHTKEALDLLPLEDMCKQLIRKGLRSDQAGHCGLHVHISRKLFGETEEEQDKNILNMIIFYHHFWDDVAKFSRRRNFHYCSKLPVTTEEDMKVYIKKKGYHNISNYEARYTAINLTNTRADTVEVRIMKGTLNAHTLRATLDFVDHIAKRSLTIADEDIKDSAKWLEGISDRCIEYMKIRGCFGYTLDTLTEEV